MTAPMIPDGPMTGEWFAAYARKIRAPTLSAEDAVIPDNLPAHKGAAAQEAMEAVGTRLLFLPPCSPDFSLVENIFARMKAMEQTGDAANPRDAAGCGVRCACRKVAIVS
ncbi:transposase [Acetobacter fallax]|nr:transposase [Acetobacter fallax]